MSKISITATTTGINKENIDVLIAAACSPVATTALPVPAVSLDDASLARTVPPCIVAAAPPPAKSPAVHFNKSLSIGRTEVRRRVPATTENGVATISRKLSIKGKGT